MGGEQVRLTFHPGVEVFLPGVAALGGGPDDDAAAVQRVDLAGHVATVDEAIEPAGHCRPRHVAGVGELCRRGLNGVGLDHQRVQRVRVLEGELAAGVELGVVLAELPHDGLHPGRRALDRGVQVGDLGDPPGHVRVDRVRRPGSGHAMSMPFAAVQR